MIFNMAGILIDAIDRANLDALRQTMVPNAFGTQFRVNNIDILALGNCAIRAFRLTDITINTLIINNKGHTFS
jgi:hypothetical protein